MNSNEKHSICYKESKIPSVTTANCKKCSYFADCKENNVHNWCIVDEKWICDFHLQKCWKGSKQIILGTFVKLKDYINDLKSSTIISIEDTDKQDYFYWKEPLGKILWRIHDENKKEWWDKLLKRKVKELEIYENYRWIFTIENE